MALFLLIALSRIGTLFPPGASMVRYKILLYLANGFAETQGDDAKLRRAKSPLDFKAST